MIFAAVVIAFEVTALFTSIPVQHVEAASVTFSTWSGVYHSLHREEGSVSGLSASVEEKDTGTISLKIDSNGQVDGTGSGHYYQNGIFTSPAHTCTVNGDSGYTFSFIGVVYHENFDKLELGDIRSSSPRTFTISDACDQISYESPLYPITLSGCCTIPPVILKLENASKFHYYNSTTDGPSKITTSSDITIFTQPCPTSFEGNFEPVQAVWQDDELFPDQPGKQLTKLDDRNFIAELPMVNGKQTLLTGTYDRDTMRFRGSSTYTVNVPAILRFTLHDAAGNIIFMITMRAISRSADRAESLSL